MMIVSSVAAAYPSTAEPNPPAWPDSVAVFGPGDSGIGAKIAAAYANNGGHDPVNHGQFSSLRYAFLFKPGAYDVDCPVGYYTQVLGLGQAPSDVIFTSPKGVYSEEQDYSIGGALSTFWRSAENFQTNASNDWQVGKGMLWAVSQAAPLRRIEVLNDLALYEYQPPIPMAGEASGGFMANVRVGAALRTGRSRRAATARTGADVVEPGSQQQWFTRDSTVSGFQPGVWNMVFTGVEGAPPSHCGGHGGSPATTVAQTPTIAEKPYITIGADGKYALALPPLKRASSGADFASDAAESVGFESVYVTKPGDTAATINAKLAAGLHIVFTPAIYALDAPLVVATPGQVLLGLGLATLVSARQTAIIQVANVDGVRIAGLLLQAGPTHSAASSAAPASSAVNANATVLLEWGTGGYAGNPDKPGLLHDLFARVGGPDGTAAHPVAVTTMVHIRSGHVIGDNLWLWRADHAANGAVSFETNGCDHGLVVDGDDVTMYGLAVEHTRQDLTLWNGERGRTYFYQSELPYGATQDEFGTPGYAGYRVAPHVQAHAAWGVGVYSFFRDHNVSVASGIVCPSALEANFVAPLSVFLNGHGQIAHVLNDKGGPSCNAAEGCDQQQNWVC